MSTIQGVLYAFYVYVKMITGYICYLIGRQFQHKRKSDTEVETNNE